MSFNRYARRADATTQQIVDELRALGYVVTYLGLPVDLAVTHPTWPRNTFRFLECKTPRGKKGAVRLDKRQQAQREFCERHQVPYVTNGLQALTYLRQSAPVPTC